ncbi:MAG TPA: GNAT family N-acetyltransferase [Streptosporangiaceae bacterium]|nr:GNAT family N-acetyltransferase [Streptosporangiaceae bacterium]
MTRALEDDATPREFGRLLTDRLDLRAVGRADVDALHPILSDPHSSRFIAGGGQASPDDTLAWLERFAASWKENGLGYWTVRLRAGEAGEAGEAGGTVIGVGGAERRPGFWNLFYFLDRDHWGSGYATELARAAARAARARDPDLPLAAWIHEQNTGSQAVVRRLGLRDHGLREVSHWKGAPMHYWADQAP